MTDVDRIPEWIWREIVANLPIVAVDLVVTTGEGVVLGKRTNDPAKGEWFVPGGRILKHERLTDAVHRVAREELDVDVSIREQLDVFEHFWDTTEFGDIDSKHYVVIAPTSNHPLRHSK